MAEVTFNPATGQFEEGNYTQIAQRIEAMQARPDTAALDASEEAHRYRNEGRWIGSEDLARGTGIERTIRSGSGGSKGNAVVGRDYRGSDTIEIQGQRMSLDIAASIGLIKRDSGGGFSFNGEAEGGAPKDTVTGDRQAAPEEEAEAAFRTSEETIAAMTALAHSTGQGDQAAALNAVIETGEVSELALQRLARNSGQTQEQIEGQVQQICDGYRAAISSRMEGLGVHDMELFDEFIHNSRNDREMKEAMRGLLMRNDTSGLDQLAASYTEALDEIDPEAVKEALDAAGIRHVQQKYGPILLHLPGCGEVSYRAAVKAGLIKVSRA